MLWHFYTGVVRYINNNAIQKPQQCLLSPRDWIFMLHTTLDQITVFFVCNLDLVECLITHLWKRMSCVSRNNEYDLRLFDITVIVMHQWHHSDDYSAANCLQSQKGLSKLDYGLWGVKSGRKSVWWNELIKSDITFIIG